MKRLRFLLYPFSIIYDLITGVRNAAFDYGWLPVASFDIPVIAVGNLSTGGTGKTPMIEYLIKHFSTRKVAVLSRGYGRKTKGYIEVSRDHKAIQVGDEPLQFKKKFKESLVVSVCEDRVEGIRRLLLDHSLDVILLDDAYQHRYVKASHYILLTDYSQLYYKDYLLPAGNLRESRRGASRANSIVVTKCPADLSAKKQHEIDNRLQLKASQKVYFSTISYAQQAVGANGKLVLDQLKDKEVTVITGIAKPQYFIEYLQAMFTVEHLKFPDHYNYKASDFINLKKDQIILTTEKDYMRLLQCGLENLYFIPIETRFIGERLQLSISDNS